MDVLYILGNGSQWKNKELRYSLRSLERFAANVDRIFVTGVDPGFLAPEVIFTPADDPGPSRSFNHVHKVRETILKTDISERFLLNYDDNFLMAPVDIEKYPFYYRGTLPAVTETQRAYRYSLINAREYLLKHGKPILNWSVHCPCIYEREKFMALEDAWKLCEKEQFGLAVRSVYLNWYGIEGEYLKDCKLKTVQNIQETSLAIQGRSVFSIHDKAIPNGVATLLEEYFPNPSRWEVPE